ncbi:MAG: putative two-component system sensor kinase [Frankiales bacterium]|nr:putative two-component system sensor kinase [Frankiales bacterium]
MTAGTLRGRLALVAVLATAVWVLLATAAIDLVLVHQLRSQADDVLRARSDAAVAAVEEDGPAIDQAELESPVWVLVDGRVVRAPARRAQLEARVLRLAAEGAGFRDVEGPDVRLYARPFTTGSISGVVVSSVDLHPYTRSARLVVGGSAVLALVLVGGVYPITRQVVARALRPVTDMSDRAAQWSAADVTQRFGLSARPQELARLSRDLDGLLDRLAAVLRHEQQLSAEISHELRTPLSRIVAEVDLLQSTTSQDPQTAAALTAVASSAGQMDGILETLLATARAAGTQPPGRCEVEDAVREAVAEVGPQDLVRLDSVTGAAGVARPLLVRMLVPVLQNAARFARSRVEVTTESGDDGLHVLVRDDGPGLGGLGDSAFEPGVRGRPDGDGAGLGLALSRRLARSCGGDVTVRPSASGAVLDVRVPAG